MRTPTAMRKPTALAILALALALPASTLASEIGGTMDEVFELEAPTIAMTVPLTVQYFQNQETWDGYFVLTGIATNNWKGLTITATFSDVTKTVVGAEATPLTIPSSERALVADPTYFDDGQAPPTGGQTYLPDGAEKSYAKGDIASGTPVDIAVTTGPVTPAAEVTGAVMAAWTSKIYGVTVPGHYSGTVDFLATTNP